jgi:hypothetical protein
MAQVVASAGVVAADTLAVTAVTAGVEVGQATLLQATGASVAVAVARTRLLSRLLGKVGLAQVVEVVAAHLTLRRAAVVAREVTEAEVVVVETAALAPSHLAASAAQALSPSHGLRATDELLKLPILHAAV